jgi:hypothetical protein
MGNFIVNDNNYLMTKLYNYCNGKLSEFIQVLKNLDNNNIGKINLHDFIKGLKEKNLIFRNINQGNIVEPKDINDIIQLLIIHMKKNQDKKNEVNKISNNNIENSSKEKLSIYDLYYEPIINLINSNCKSEAPLFKAIIKKYLIDNKISSLMNFFAPLFKKNDVIINKGLDRYIKSQTFVEYLINNDVIPETENFLLPYEKDVLLDINQLVNEIDEANPLLNCFEENKENIINDIINNMSDN